MRIKMYDRPIRVCDGKLVVRRPDWTFARASQLTVQDFEKFMRDSEPRDELCAEFERRCDTLRRFNQKMHEFCQGR